MSEKAKGKGALVGCALFLSVSVCLRAQTFGRPVMLRGVGIDQKLNQQVPLDLPFTDENGRAVQLREYFGRRPVVLALVYYQCPMLCNMVLNGLLRSLKGVSLQAGEQYEVVTVSFDPRETPALAAAKKRTYVEKYNRKGAERGWHFLTGRDAPIRALADAVGFHYNYNPITNQFAHASGIMILTPEGRVSRYFYGIEYLSQDVRLGLVEASANRIGTLTDQILLFCYHYDPTQGKYGLVIMNVIRVLGSATVLALGILIAVLLRNDFRHKHV